MEILIELLKRILNIGRNIRNRYYCNCTEERITFELKKWYKRKTGRTLDLNNPTSLNDKIQWLKMYDSTQQKADFTDKYRVRAWVEDKIGKQYLIPLLGVWDSYEEIDFNQLPDKFVLKTNNASGTNLIIKDKSLINHNLYRLKINRWLNSNFAFKSGFELHYGLISPKIVCEKHMGDNINDYKIFCINGVPQFIWVDRDRYIGHKRKVFTPDWKEAPFYVGTFDKIQGVNDSELRPQKLDEMLSLAATLSKDFCFVRVDMYEIDGNVFFGEMTFTPSSGTEQFAPYEYDDYFGKKIVLPKKKSIPLKQISTKFNP